ncbi:hypothetical protein D3C71_1256230 [compost metagenome]
MPRPLSLAWCMAASAQRSSASPVVACSGKRLIPMEGDTVSGTWPRVNTPCMDASSLSATRAASSGPCTSVSTTTNSSPPSRATTSASRTPWRRRSATLHSSWSPAWWPSESFTVLKWSRFTKSTAARPWRLRASDSTCDSCSIRKWRLGNCVSVSCSAMKASRSWACLRAVMSRTTTMR